MNELSFSLAMTEDRVKIDFSVADYRATGFETLARARFRAPLGMPW
jgi:hypothetical protein